MPDRMNIMYAGRTIQARSMNQALKRRPQAAAAKGVRKFILVTSIGTGDSKDAPPTQVYDVLKPVLLEKEKAEEALKVRSSSVV